MVAEESMTETMKANMATMKENPCESMNPIKGIHDKV